jgi:hypothetical protein
MGHCTEWGQKCVMMGERLHRREMFCEQKSIFVKFKGNAKIFKNKGFRNTMTASGKMSHVVS